MRLLLPLPLALLLTACGADTTAGPSLCNGDRYRLVTVGLATECVDTRTGRSADPVRCTCNEEPVFASRSDAALAPLTDADGMTPALSP